VADLFDWSTVASTPATVVYTDGACSGNPGPGGWAWVVPDGAFASGYAPQATNQRMEIMAAFEAVGALPGRLEVRSDSTYVVNCFRDRWWEGWLARGWVNSQRKPVANRDLWEPFVELVRGRGDVTFSWVKGHSGDRWNDVVDRLAVEAIREREGRSGDRPPEPDAIGPADVVDADDGPFARTGAGAAGGEGGAARARAALAGAAPKTGASYQDGISGHALLVVGHQPPELGGYGPNPVADAVRGRLAKILAAKAELEPDLVVVTGLRLGAEQLGAEAAIDAGVPFVAVLPYPEPDEVWPAESRAHFATLLAAARDVLVLQKRKPESRQQAGAALARRDAWLARHVEEAVVVWDGDDARLGRLHRSLEDHLGADVWLVDPKELVR
jgi:ribonuclease HI